MQAIARIAERKTEQAAGIFREQQRRLTEECSRQAQLSDFQDEYQRRHTADGESGVTAGALKNNYRFMTQLHAVSVSADERVQQARAACERHHQAWSTARARARAIDQVSQRHEMRERLERERREQTELEDRAMSVKLGEREAD